MNAHIDNTRQQLGELGAMGRQTEDMERHILSVATERLDAMRGELEHACVEALTGNDDAKARYAGMVTERGRLEQVIARARAELGAG